MLRSTPFVRRRMALTSLIDVIFLLLLFFMLTSTFSAYGEIELGQATAGPVTAAETPAERVFVQIGAERLTLNGAPTTLDDLAAEVQAGQVLVSLDDDTTAQRLVDLLVRLRDRPDLSVMVLE